MDSGASGLRRSLATLLLLSSALVSCGSDSSVTTMGSGDETSATEGLILIAGIGFISNAQFRVGDIEEQDNGASTLRIVPLIGPQGANVVLARERGPVVDLEDHAAAVTHLSPTQLAVNGRPAVLYGTGARSHLVWEPTGVDGVLLSLSSGEFGHERMLELAMAIEWNLEIDDNYTDPGVPTGTAVVETIHP